MRARSVIIASGARYRRLEIPGLEAFEGAGIYYGATFVEARACVGDEVAVIGGGNSAGQAAMFLSQHAGHVHLLVRRDSVAASMSSDLTQRLEASPRITIHYHTEVVGLEGDGHLEGMTWRRRDTGTTSRHAIRHAYVMIGAVPQTDWLDRRKLARDDQGFIRTGPDLEADHRARYAAVGREPCHLETSVPGIFAVGDVRAGSVKRVASAVGEGAMAVQFVHRTIAEFAEAGVAG